MKSHEELIAEREARTPPGSTGWYEHPDDLKPEQLDPLIRDIVMRINESGWVWTGESCQGHPDADYEMLWANNTSPMLRLICRREHLGAMMVLLVSLRIDSPWGDTNTRFAGLRIYPHVVTDEWATILVYTLAVTVYDRNIGLGAFAQFAEAVNSLKPCV